MELAAAAAVAVLIWAAVEAMKRQAAEEPVPVRVEDDEPRRERR